jgi:conjugative relaxase-like TrwC/TraI family protein
MLRVVPQNSVAGARSYYTQGLQREDYYSQGQEIIGKWYGKAAALLGLSGDVKGDEFIALVENRHPISGEKLTLRTKANRIVGYDCNFHAPKSLSILHALTGDERIVQAFRDSVAETMSEMEAQVSTRVRKDGAQSDRVTGNMVWAEFVHFTSRPIEGIPDPHLHVHCVVSNCTFDAVENRWKAGKFQELKSNASYSEAGFHARLTAKLTELGYPVVQTPKGWEIAGISRPLIEKFSRRTELIEEIAKAKGVTDAKAKDKLGAASRESKRKGISNVQMRAEWESRLSLEERAEIAAIRKAATAPRPSQVSAKEAIDYAFEKLFEKNSVVEANRVVREALRFGVGRLSPSDVWQEFGTRKMIAKEIGGRMYCTSMEVLAEEVSLINFVRDGRGGYARLKAGVKSQTHLSAEQNRALRHILNSQDQVIALKGAAGAGKTTLMKSVVQEIEASGKQVFVFAPSAAAARETLPKEGFKNVETVAQLLHNPKLQQAVRGQVIWVDEAGLLGVRDMWKLMQIAGSSTRIILTGDTAQHAPVTRGDAFRLLQRYAGLKIAQLNEIRRQEREEYREAVSALAKGDLKTGFRLLDEIGAMVEIPNAEERYRKLAEEFMALKSKNSVPLVVSPTHAESAMVTSAIRDARREAKELSGERIFTQLHNLQWEEADRKRSESYHAGLVVQFHQNARGITRGEMFRVTEVTESGEVRLKSAAGKEAILPREKASRFQVYETREITLGRGERVRITRNGDSADGRRLNNGNIFVVKGFDRNGRIVLSTGAVLDPTHGLHLTYGYCQTSYSSQGKTVRDVLIAQSASSFSAGSKEQFYVSVSRGKETVQIFTDDRRGLQAAVGNSATRRSGIELAGLDQALRSTPMKDDDRSRQWRDLIQSRKTAGVGMSQLSALLKERRQDPSVRKDGVVQWEKYVEMRRNNAGPDGKCRAMVNSGNPSRGMKKIPTAGKPFLRPTQLNDAKPNITPPINELSAEKLKNNEKVAQVRDVKLEGKAKSISQAAKNLKTVLGRQYGKIKDQVAKPRVPNMPRPTPAQAARHTQRQKRVEQVKPKAPVKKIQPPPPTPRKGK